jgi:hypothetical protein
MAMLLNWLATFRVEAVIDAWFNSNFNFPSITLKLIQLPFFPRLALSVIVKMGLPEAAFLTASN